jgi:hypothetical protein
MDLLKLDLIRLTNLIDMYQFASFEQLCMQIG